MPGRSKAIKDLSKRQRREWKKLVRAMAYRRAKQQGIVYCLPRAPSNSELVEWICAAMGWDVESFETKYHVLDKYAGEVPLEPTTKPAKSFYETDEWRRLRYEVLRNSKGRCECCGHGPRKGKPLHVDHIKPRSKYPELELEITNLQVLCDDCNLGKGAWDETDWRGKGLKAVQ